MTLSPNAKMDTFVNGGKKGSLKRVRSYYSASNVNASGCADPDLDGSDYKAWVVTVEQAGTKYLLGAMFNDSGILWSSVEI